MRLKAARLVPFYPLETELTGWRPATPDDPALNAPA
jgi:hypothetical protein